ncbi:MAG: helix-turn-helix domain-containing protein [Firmicutes bacterium]|nr:helix-turn-helix domain-containing protein [Bacillota bacterium]
MNKMFLQLKTPYEIQREIASQAKERRKALKLTQSRLAERSGVSLGSVKRFEQSGEISLASLLKIALVLDCLGDFEGLFVKAEYSSIEEVIDEKRRANR